MTDILSCRCTAPDGSGWMLERMGSKSLLTRVSGAKRRMFRINPKTLLSVDIILNLKMFFRDLAPEWSGLERTGEPAHASIELAFSDEKFLLPPDAKLEGAQKNVCADLLRYFESVSGGTYKECGCSFDSFDGGGPEYSAVSDGSGVFTWSAEKDYKSKKHETIDGAAYGFDFTFWPLRPGEGTCVITGSSPIVPGTKRTVTITVNESLASECTVGEETETDSGPEYDEETEDGAPVCGEETEEDG